MTNEPNTLRDILNTIEATPITKLPTSESVWGFKRLRELRAQRAEDFYTVYETKR